MPKRPFKRFHAAETPGELTGKHSDDDLLYGVVEALERETGPTGHLMVITALVNHGPLLVVGGNTQAVLAHVDRPDQNAALCAELRRFLRAAVHPDDTATTANHLSTAMAVEYRITAGRVSVAGNLHDLVALQLLLLVDRVGLRRLRICAGADCARMFVKRRKELFCSKTCQRRTEVRRRLERERLEDEKHQEAMARRKRIRAVRGASQ
jgi:hypothetical protein